MLMTATAIIRNKLFDYSFKAVRFYRSKFEEDDFES